jgi:hypothetical protein
MQLNELCVGLGIGAGSKLLLRSRHGQVDRFYPVLIDAIFVKVRDGLSLTGQRVWCWASTATGSGTCWACGPTARAPRRTTLVRVRLWHRTHAE